MSEQGLELTADPLLLIAYQFSDLLIPLILFGIASQPKRTLWWSLALFFTVYAITVGFRYRLVLLWFPIVAGWYGSSGKSLTFRNGAMALTLLLAMTGFAVLTLTRSKFSGLNLSGIADFDSEQFIYGVFAETNIVFGWAAAKATYGNALSHIGFTPLVETITQFIPRFIYPDKALYQHLYDINFALAGTNESLYSGTSLPFFGEYFAMFGQIGVYLGTALFGAFLAYLIRKLRISAESFRAFCIGSALVAIYFCYFYFSRGSLSSIAKGAIFVVLPYLLSTVLIKKTETATEPRGSHRA